MSIVLKIMLLSLLAIDVQAAVDVQVAKLDGTTAAGKLGSISAESVTLATNDGEATSIPLQNVIEVTFETASADSEPNEPNPTHIELTDGTRILITSTVADAEKVTVTTEQLGDLKIQRAGVRAILMQPLNDEWSGQWDAFLKRNNSKDMLIIAKRDGGGLDFLAGLVSAIRDGQIQFLLDGDNIDVPQTRVTGIVFADSKKEGRVLQGEIDVKLLGDSSVRARSIVTEGDQVRLETSWGQTVSVPIGSLIGIDFSSGRLHYLSDLEPLTERYFGLDPPGKEWGPLFENDLSTRTGLSSQWRMSRDCFANNGRPPLTLRGQTYRKGLCIFPSAKIDYALDGRYSRLNALVGVDDDVAFNQRKGQPPTKVELRIEADGQQIFQQLIAAPEAPFPLDLKVSGVTTLSILVDFGDGRSTCDYIDLADAKLIVDTSAK